MRTASNGRRTSIHNYGPEEDRRVNSPYRGKIEGQPLTKNLLCQSGLDVQLFPKAKNKFDITLPYLIRFHLKSQRELVPHLSTASGSLTGSNVRSSRAACDVTTAIFHKFPSVCTTSSSLIRAATGRGLIGSFATSKSGIRH